MKEYRLYLIEQIMDMVPGKYERNYLTSLNTSDLEWLCDRLEAERC